MAKKAIVLEQPGEGTGKQTEVRAVLWADVPVARQTFYADPNKTSAFRNADAGELAALRTGAVAERVVTIRRDPGTTNAQIRTAIEAEFAAWQAEVTAYNPWSRYGSSWDGTTWTGVTVA